MMKEMSMRVFGAVVVISAILGVLIGFLLESQPQKTNTPAQIITEQATQADTMQPTQPAGNNTAFSDLPDVIDAEALPTPVVMKLDRSIKSISTDMIVVSGTEGEMILSTIEPALKVYKRDGTNLTIGTLSDLKVGQSVTVNIIRPGEEVVVVIEN